MRGPGMKAEKTRPFTQGTPQDTVTIDGREVKVHVVTLYKHLGGMVHLTQRMEKEAKQRIAKAAAAARGLKQHWKATQLNQEARASAMKTLVLTRLYHNGGTWGQEDPRVRSEDGAEGYLMAPQRETARKRQAGFDKVEARLTAAILRFFRRVLRYGSPALRATLSESKEWIGEVQKRLAEVAKGSFDYRHAPSFEEAARYWSAMLSEDDRGAEAVRVTRDTAKLAAVGAKIKASKGDEQDGDSKDDEIMCGLCFKTCRDLQRLNAHRALAHGWLETWG